MYVNSKLATMPILLILYVRENSTSVSILCSIGSGQCHGVQNLIYFSGGSLDMFRGLVDYYGNRCSKRVENEMLATVETSRGFPTEPTKHPYIILLSQKTSRAKQTLFIKFPCN